MHPYSLGRETLKTDHAGSDDDDDDHGTISRFSAVPVLMISTKLKKNREAIERMLNVC